MKIFQLKRKKKKNIISLLNLYMLFWKITKENCFLSGKLKKNGKGISNNNNYCWINFWIFLLVFIDISNKNFLKIHEFEKYLKLILKLTWLSWRFLGCYILSIIQSINKIYNTNIIKLDIFRTNSNDKMRKNKLFFLFTI